MREGRRLKSEVLRADAKHTRSDVLTTGAVLGALLGVWWGYPLLDPMAALLVAGFIGHACWSIAQEASRILADEIVLPEAQVRAVVQSVPEVLGCEKIRTRGSADYAFLDLAPLAEWEHVARTGARHVSHRQGPADDAIPAVGGRGDPHRAATAFGIPDSQI